MNVPQFIIAMLVFAGAILFVLVSQGTSSKLDVTSAEVKAQAAEIDQDFSKFMNDGKASQAVQDRAAEARRKADTVAAKAQIDNAAHDKTMRAIGESLSDLAGLNESK